MQYHFLVVSTDAQGNQNISQDNTFRTVGAQLKVIVLNKDNRPITGALVSTVDLSTETDVDGVALFNDLPIGTQTVKAVFQGNTASADVNIDQLQPEDGLYTVTIQMNSNQTSILPFVAGVGGSILIIGALFMVFKKLKQGRKHKNENTHEPAPKKRVVPPKPVREEPVIIEKATIQPETKELKLEPLPPSSATIIGSGPLFPPNYHPTLPNNAAKPTSPQISQVKTASSDEEVKQPTQSRTQSARKYLTPTSNKKPAMQALPTPPPPPPPPQKAPPPPPPPPTKPPVTGAPKEVVVVIKHDK
jgi:hypothetical protein